MLTFYANQKNKKHIQKTRNDSQDAINHKVNYSKIEIRFAGERFAIYTRCVYIQIYNSFLYKIFVLLVRSQNVGMSIKAEQ